MNWNCLSTCRASVGIPLQMEREARYYEHVYRLPFRSIDTLDDARREKILKRTGSELTERLPKRVPGARGRTTRGLRLCGAWGWRAVKAVCRGVRLTRAEGLVGRC